MIRHTPAALLLSAIAVAAIHTPAPADACSYAAAEWVLAHRGNTIIAPAGGVIVVTVQGYTNPFEELAPLDEAGFTVELTDGAGDVLEATVVIEPGVNETTGRLIVTPNEPLAAGASYQVEIQRGADDTNPSVLPIEVFDSVAGPDIVPSALTATETRSIAEQACCDTPEEDNACFMDDCGDFTFGECRLCWPTSFEYPVSAYVTWEVASDAPSGYLDFHVYRVDDGSEELLGSHIAPQTVNATWPVGFEGPFCMRIETTDVIRDTSSSQEVCVELADVDTIERTQVETSEFESRCVPGTIDSDVPDDPDDPDNPDADDDDSDPDQDGSNSKGEPGGCSTVNLSTAPSLWPLLLGVLVGRRRRAR